MSNDERYLIDRLWRSVKAAREAAREARPEATPEAAPGARQGGRSQKYGLRVSKVLAGHGHIFVRGGLRACLLLRPLGVEFTFKSVRALNEADEDGGGAFERRVRAGTVVTEVPRGWYLVEPVSEDDRQRLMAWNDHVSQVGRVVFYCIFDE